VPAPRLTLNLQPSGPSRLRNGAAHPG
jgi:hypothetical protein